MLTLEKGRFGLRAGLYRSSAYVSGWAFVYHAYTCPLSRRGGCYFCSRPKVTKRLVRRNASLPHRHLRCKPGKTSGCSLSLHTAFRAEANASAKSHYALPNAHGLLVFPGFGRSCSADGLAASFSPLCHAVRLWRIGTPADGNEAISRQPSGTTKRVGCHPELVEGVRKGPNACKYSSCLHWLPTAHASRASA